ncbi:pyridoxamine 5'-phosphate oxidase family protein [Nocardioides sp.]|uniref:pyridoxamine 5'-phosphate oxidase family protein n=1 Tax=Nocardioides sp. TaxID=35761 RepID=UPI001A261B75|nr:pyridoxamine 5'-phosphate oxidase family protein [Nocardioides sp.]MBJ7358198.1 pyridoxamine 5'-phosphate oxidase family protein [Nocardioides sp.]
METTNLAELYGLSPLDWATITAGLDAGLTLAPDTGGPNRHSCWLTTLNQDGGPHTTGIGAQWHDGSWWFETGRGTRKGRNVARDPRCTLAVATHDFDLVVEGIAELVTDPAVVSELAEVWASGGWPCRVDASGTALTAEFSAPSAGRPPWHVYKIVATSAVALATTGDGGATRWTF